MEFITPELFKQAYDQSLQWAEGAFIVAILLLSFNYWGVVSLEKFPIPHFVSGLYIYLILNGLFLYRRYSVNTKKRVVSGKICPFCGNPLLVDTYVCSNCKAKVDKPIKK